MRACLHSFESGGLELAATVTRTPEELYEMLLLQEAESGSDKILIPRH